MCDRQCSIITFLSNVEHPAYQGRSVACSLRLLTFIFLLFFSFPSLFPSLPFPSQTATFAEGEKILAFHGPQIYEGKVCDVLLVITMSFLYKNAIWRDVFKHTPVRYSPPYSKNPSRCTCRNSLLGDQSGGKAGFSREDEPALLDAL